MLNWRTTRCPKFKNEKFKECAILLYQCERSEWYFSFIVIHWSYTFWRIARYLSTFKKKNNFEPSESLRWVKVWIFHTKWRYCILQKDKMHSSFCKHTVFGFFVFLFCKSLPSQEENLSTIPENVTIANTFLSYYVTFAWKKFSFWPLKCHLYKKAALKQWKKGFFSGILL